MRSGSKRSRLRLIPGAVAIVGLVVAALFAGPTPAAFAVQTYTLTGHVNLGAGVSAGAGEVAIEFQSEGGVLPPEASASGSVLTDSLGNYSISNLVGRYRVYFRYLGTGNFGSVYWNLKPIGSAWDWVNLSASDQVANIALPPPAALGGTIYLGDSATPASAGTVEISYQRWNANSSSFWDDVPVQTLGTNGAGGTYSIPTAAADIYRIHFHYIGPGAYQDRYWSTTNPPPSPWALSDITFSAGIDDLSKNIILPAKVGISGQVYFGSTSVHAGSGVVVTPIRINLATGAHDELATVLSDSSGAYSIAGLDSGAYELRFDVPDGSFRSTLVENISLPNASAVVDAVMPPAYTIAGHVSLDTAGNSAGAGAVRAIVSYIPNGDEVASALTDAGGNYVLQGLASRTWYLRFEYQGSADYPVWFSDGGSGPGSRYVVDSTPVVLTSSRSNVNVVVGAGAAIGGTLRDSGGTPIASEPVYAYAFYSTGPHKDEYAGQYTTTTQADGTYRFRALPTPYYYVVDFGGWPDSAFAYEAWRSSSSYFYPDTVPLSGTDVRTDVDATLYHPGSIFGTVTGHGSAAAAAVSSGQVQAQIEVFDSFSDSWVETGDYYPVAPDGTYRIDGLFPDDYKVQFSNSGASLLTSPMMSIGEGDQHQFDATIVVPGFVSLVPARLLDTRVGDGAPVGAVAPGGVLSLQVTGRGGVPASGVSAVVLNVTVVGSTGAGYITAYADGAARPWASNLNFVAGQIVPNLVVVPVGANGRVALYNSGGSTQLVADVAGYYLTG